MRHLKLTITAAALFLVAPLAVFADPIGFNFSQGGWEFPEGSGEGDFEIEIVGMFWGEDLNGDGLLVSFDEEITGFMMDILVDGEVEFVFDLADPFAEVSFFGLIYDLVGGFLGDGEDEGIGLNFVGEDLDWFYAAGPEPLAGCGIGGPCGTLLDEIFTFELVSVTPKAVPEPGTLLLLITGLAGMGAVRRRIHS